MTDRTPTTERLSSKIEVAEDGCWLWTSALDRDGYGQVSVDGRPRLAHRVVYAELMGAIPDGMTLDHLCRNRRCVRPAHLEPVIVRQREAIVSEVRAALSRENQP